MEALSSLFVVYTYMWHTQSKYTGHIVIEGVHLRRSIEAWLMATYDNILPGSAEWQQKIKTRTEV